MLVEPALFYLLCRSFARSQSDLLRLADALLLSGVLVAGIGLALYVRCQLGGLCIGVIEAEGGAQRLASVYGSPNNVGLWLGRCVPFALAYLLIALPGSRWRRWLAGGALVLLLVATLLTQSAGALLFGLPAGMGLVLLLVYGRRAWLPLTGLAAAAGALVLLLAQVSSRFAGLFLSERGTNFIRLRVWESSLEMIRHHPLTGLGLDQFLYFYGGQYIRPDAIADKDLSHPHNILLDFWLRLGIGGVLLLIALQIYFWRSLYALYRQCRHTDPVILALLCGTAGSMAALLAHGLIDNSVFVKDLAYVFCLLLALAVALPNARSIDGYPE
ncbi:MAG: O-antigen ligase family protein [Anaerolineae bacterium]|nr:O-antigen ligase family protein [Anaerolineae bacterium]